VRRVEPVFFQGVKREDGTKKKGVKGWPKKKGNGLTQLDTLKTGRVKSKSFRGMVENGGQGGERKKPAMN